MAFIHSPKIVTDGLIYYLDTANPRSFVSGSTTVYNLLNPADTGSLIGTARYGNDILGAIQIPSSASQDAVAINTPISSSFVTYEVWARAVRQSDYGFIMYNNINEFITQAYMGIMVDNSTAGVINAFIGSGNRTAMQTNITASLNSTYHICLVVSGNVQTSYVNGIPQKTTTVGTTANYNTITYFGDPPNSSRGMSGSLYAVRFYNRPLSADEIVQNFNANRSRFGV